MSEDIKPENGAIPPRLTIKVPGAGVAAEAVPAEAPPPATKKKTSRMSLDQVTADPGAPAAPVSGVGVASKTIRLAPAISGQLVSSSMPVGKALSGVLMSADDGKRTTSRIPLESVLSPKSETPAGGGDATPKTIKVKRPTISVGSKVAAMPVDAAAVPGPVPTPSAAASAKNQTARVDILPDMVIEAQQTQKKTIKIRRADGAGGEVKATPRTVGIVRAEGESSEAAVADQAQVAAPHWIFPSLAAVALLLICFMIYVLAAQAYPNLGWSLGG